MPKLFLTGNLFVLTIEVLVSTSIVDYINLDDILLEP